MNDLCIAIIGCGYVGLELAKALSQHYTVLVYDINPQRIHELKCSQDKNLQFNFKELFNDKIKYFHSIDDIKHAKVFIITVPTPVHYYEFPNLQPLEQATKTVGSILKKGDLIIYESSVYPGTTTNICIPILEGVSKLKENKDFFVGYSPERISPGDEKYSLDKVTKIISASNDKTLQIMKSIYEKVCLKIHTVSKIEYAEAAKILENTQRDVNIALMNEFTKIMHSMSLDMNEVLRAAKTKSNFLPFKPGLVGGHCISIDPHYIAFQAKRFSVQPDLILCARKINDSMTQYIFQEMLKILNSCSTHPAPYKIGIFGVTYKKNIPDLRNSLVFKFIKECKELPIEFIIHDPYYQQDIQKQNEIIHIHTFSEIKDLDMAIIFVDHSFYKKKGLTTFIKKCVAPGLIMDIPGMFAEQASHHLLKYWKL